MSLIRCSRNARCCLSRRPHKRPSRPAASQRSTPCWSTDRWRGPSSSTCSGSCRCLRTGRTCACHLERRPAAPQCLPPWALCSSSTQGRRTRRPSALRPRRLVIVGASAQSDSDPWKGAALEENRTASLPQPVQSFLDPAAHFLGQFEHQPRVVCRLRAEMKNVDWLPECNEPFRWQRKQSRQAKPWKRRRERSGRKPEKPRERLEIEQDRMYLLRPDDRDRNDRRSGSEGHLHEPTTPHPLYAIAISVTLCCTFDALRENAHELVAFQKSGRVVGMREHVAGLGQQHARERHGESPVDDKHASVPRLGMLGDDRGADHRPVVRNHARVVGDQERAAMSRNVAYPIDLDPPVLSIEPERDALDSFGKFRIEAEVVASVLRRLARIQYAKSPHLVRVWQHAVGLDMALDLQAAATEYLGWLQLEANRSTNTVRA